MYKGYYTKVTVYLKHYREHLLIAGFPATQSDQSETALAALLKAGSVTILTAWAYSTGHYSIDVEGGTEWVAKVSLRNKLELLCRWHYKLCQIITIMMIISYLAEEY